jgi:hypothetical protein
VNAVKVTAPQALNCLFVMNTSSIPMVTETTMADSFELPESAIRELINSLEQDEDDVTEVSDVSTTDSGHGSAVELWDAILAEVTEPDLLRATQQWLAPEDLEDWDETLMELDQESHFDEQSHNPTTTEAFSGIEVLERIPLRDLLLWADTTAKSYQAAEAGPLELGVINPIQVDSDLAEQPLQSGPAVPGEPLQDSHPGEAQDQADCGLSTATLKLAEVEAVSSSDRVQYALRPAPRTRFASFCEEGGPPRELWVEAETPFRSGVPSILRVGEALKTIGRCNINASSVVKRRAQITSALPLRHLYTVSARANTSAVVEHAQVPHKETLGPKKALKALPPVSLPMERNATQAPVGMSGRKRTPKSKKQKAKKQLLSAHRVLNRNKDIAKLIEDTVVHALEREPICASSRTMCKDPSEELNDLFDPHEKSDGQEAMTKGRMRDLLAQFKQVRPNTPSHCERCGLRSAQMLALCKNLHLTCARCTSRERRCSICEQQAYISITLTQTVRQLARFAYHIRCPGRACVHHSNRQEMLLHTDTCPKIKRIEPNDDGSWYCRMYLPNQSYNVIHGPGEYKAIPFLMAVPGKEHVRLVLTVHKYKDCWQLQIAYLSATPEIVCNPVRVTILDGYLRPTHNEFLTVPVDYVHGADEARLWKTTFNLSRIYAQVLAESSNDCSTTVFVCKVDIL